MSADYLGTHDFSLATVLWLWGGWASIYESTVWATGADYTTLWAAIAAWKTRILVIDDTTETWNITIPTWLIVHWLWKDVVNINMWTYVFTASSDEPEFKDLKITIAYTSWARLISDSNSNFTFTNVYFDDNSTVSWTYRTWLSWKTKYINCTFDLPNVANGWISITWWYLKDCYITWWWTLMDIFMSVNNTIIENVLFDARYASWTNWFDLNNSSIMIWWIIKANYTSTQIIDANSSIVRWVEIECNAGWYISNAIVANNWSLIENILFDDNTFTSSDLLITATNSNISWTSTFTWITAVSWSVINWYIWDTPITITGDDNTIASSKIGQTTWGWTNTITINAAADRTIVNGCRTDAAISDSGTWSVLTWNVVY